MKATSLINAMLIGVLLLSAGNAWAEENKGAASIVMNGGSMGSITFPHGLHQNVFVDCKPCHELFGKEPKVIDKMKAEGKLKKQQVMNMCKNCHKDLAAKGEKGGPTACTDCHKK
jgi:hypothetical protein